MESLRIPIASVPESGLDVSVSFGLRDVQLPDTDPLPLEDGVVEGTLSEVGGEYLFTGRIKASYVHPCDRCLEEARAEAESEVLWEFTADADEMPILWDGDEDVDDDDAADVDLPRPITNGMIDLTPVVWEELVIMAPGKFVCREECQGLCSRCGANLNEGACPCGTNEPETKGGHQGFAKLAELYPDLLNKPTEE